MQCSSGMGRMVLFTTCFLFCLSDRSSFHWRNLPLPIPILAELPVIGPPDPGCRLGIAPLRLMLVVCPLGYSDRSKHQFNPRALAQIQCYKFRVYTWTPGEALFPSWSLNRDDVNLELLIGTPRTHLHCKTHGGSSVQWKRRIMYREKCAQKKDEEERTETTGRWRGQRKTSLQSKAQRRETQKRRQTSASKDLELIYIHSY